MLIAARCPAKKWVSRLISYINRSAMEAQNQRLWLFLDQFLRGFVKGLLLFEVSTGNVAFCSGKLNPVAARVSG
jgi:hypothetical protein